LFIAPSRASYIYTRVILLLLSCVLILADEYRLDVNGLLFAIPALLLTGLSRALSRINALVDVQAAPSNCKATLPILTLLTASSITLMWSVFGEGAASAVESLHFDLMPIIALNVTASAAALIMGCSYIVDIAIRNDSESSHSLATATSFDEAAVLGSKAGFVALLSIVALRRSSFSTSFQLLAFLIALVCIEGRCFSNPESSKLDSEEVVYDALSITALPKYSSDSSHGAQLADSSCYHLKRPSILRTNMLSALGLSSLFIFAFINFEPTESMKRVPSLDFSKHTPAGMDIVISMYKEPLDSVNEMISKLKSIHSISNQARVFIYIKDPAADVTQLQSSTQAFNVTKLSNIGREGATYLHHITHHWNSLAKHTIFLQADVHNPREFYPRITDYFDPVYTGMLSLGFSGQVCNGQSCGDRWGWKDTSGLIPELYQEIYNQTAAEVLLSFKGQFIVSARRIRGVRKAVYKGLLAAFVNPSSWAHKEAFLRGRANSLDKPVFGYTIERIWSILFQCSDMDVAWKCPTLLSGKRRGGGIGDCQCFDFTKSD
jgi:hypothetical protein